MAPPSDASPAAIAARPAVNLLLLAGILLVAVNLRPALASVSPLLLPIGAALGLGPFGLTALTTIPVACFAALAPASLVLQRRIGLEAAMLVVLVLLSAGLVFRLTGAADTLLVGTTIAGAAIAMGNVLLPALVKRDFPGRVGLVTGCYTTVMTSAAALAAAISVPLANATTLGWRAALGIWVVPALAALVLWLPQLGHGAHRAALPRLAGSFGRLMHSRLAWAVTLFMGLQSLGFYSILSWMPAIMQSVGVTPAKAGLMLSATTLVAIPAALATPGLATRSRDQRALLALVMTVSIAGYIGLTVSPMAAPWLWVVLIGLGQGAAFPLALTLIVLRSAGAAEAMALSAFAQTLGYAVSIAGPLGMGVIHTLTGTWWVPMACLTVMAVPCLIFGLTAGQARTVSL